MLPTRRHPRLRSLRSPARCVLTALALGWTGVSSGAVSLDDARSLHRAGRLDEALAAYREVAAAASTDTASAASATNNACLILMNTGEYAAALDECDRSLRLRRETDDVMRLARTLNNRGIVLRHLGRYAEAESSIRDAIEINTELDDARALTVNFSNLGVVAAQAGWYAQALDHQSRVVRLARDHAEEAWAGQQSRLARINQAVVLEQLGAYREALEVYRDALDEKEELSAHRQATLMMNLGVVYRNLGDPVRAVDSFEQAIETYERLGDKSALSTAFVNLGLARHLNLADPVGAEEAYGRALQLARDIGDLSEEIRDLYYLGRLLLDLGRADEAKAVYERCLETSQTSGSSEGRRVALEGLAGVARSRNELPRALELLEQAIEEIERVRASLSEDPLRADYFGEKRSVYTAAVEVLADLERIEPGAGHAERGLSLVQNAKARGLLDALGPDPERGTPREAAALARVVGGDWLLEYFAGDTQLLVWVVHDGRIELTALGDPEPVLAEVEAIHRALARGDEPSAESLQLLSEVLLHELDLSPADDDHVRIAPDRRLHYLPFELLTPRGGEGRPLVERTTVSYLPSGSALDWLRRESGPRAFGFVGFGGATLPDPDVEEPTPAGMLVSRFGLRPLPAAGEELASVGRWLPGESSVHVEDRATERALAAVVAQGARVVHLASHAVIDERPRRGAAILLTPRDRDDGLLHPDEILGLDYPVDLTVLAACRTALSAEADGDALATLTGAFLAAGSSAVVATLWDVGDAETRAFMEQFYYQLHRGLAPARALRETKRTLRRDPTWSRSNLWSAYVLVGDAAPVAARPFLRRWAPMLGAVGVLALVGLLVNRRIRRF